MRTTGKPKEYIGLDKDINGGLTAIGKIIRDAWVFGLIPETETCEGWDLTRIDALQHKVNAEWDKCGCLVSHLPEELRQKHQQIYAKAVEQAKADGWEGDDETRDDE